MQEHQKGCVLRLNYFLFFLNTGLTFPYYSKSNFDYLKGDIFNFCLHPIKILNFLSI